MEVYSSTVKKLVKYIINSGKQTCTINEIAPALKITPLTLNNILENWGCLDGQKFIDLLNPKYSKYFHKTFSTDLLNVNNSMYTVGSCILNQKVDYIPMTESEIKNHDEKTTITYSVTSTRFGDIVIVSTDKGICQVSIIENPLKEKLENVELSTLLSQESSLKDNDTLKYEEQYIKQHINNIQNLFPRALFKRNYLNSHQQIIDSINNVTSSPNPIPISLHIYGTPFQHKVWRSLLMIPKGSLVTYGCIAKKISSPSASRAVGSAVGHNPVSLVIPCHRVIQQSGKIGGFLWGEEKKRIILAMELYECEQM